MFRVDAVIVPGLGELQITPKLRREGYVKGYLGGQPDILVLNCHCTYSGLALELKTIQNPQLKLYKIGPKPQTANSPPS